MSWLHCMWGIGTMISPMVMGRVLAGGGPWTSGYRYIALFQILLSAVLFSVCRYGKAVLQAPTPKLLRRRR